MGEHYKCKKCDINLIRVLKSFEKKKLIRIEFKTGSSSRIVFLKKP